MEVTASTLGFDKFGVAAAPLPGSDEDVQQRARFAEWVAQGRAGEMTWLTRTAAEGELVRSSLHRAVPWARSVVLCATVYNAAQPYSIAPPPAGASMLHVELPPEDDDDDVSSTPASSCFRRMLSEKTMQPPRLSTRRTVAARTPRLYQSDAPAFPPFPPTPP